MEIQALLTSNLLPNDIVCQEIYKHLWKNRNLLNEAQTEAIVEDHFHLKKIIRAYFNCVDYSHVEEDDDYEEEDDDYDYDYDAKPYYMDMLMDDMIRFPISPSLKKNFEMLSNYPMKLICLLWKEMTESRKAEFYQETKEYYMSHIPEDKQRQYEKIFIEMDAIKSILKKKYKYISYATDVEGLRIDIEAVKRTLVN
jgi:hypothetical protein